MASSSAAEVARSRVESARDSPQARLGLLRDLYDVTAEVDRGYLPFRRAPTAFMNWQLRRGLLNPLDAERPGSPWWRAINERVLLDGCEAKALAYGHPGAPSSPAVTATLEFILRPSAQHWYRAHNLTIASAYLENEELARAEGRVERFFINLVLVRVLYAHAMVSAPRLALGWLGPAARPLGDPRLGMTSIFLSLSRVLPDRYPLGENVAPYIQQEHGFGHLLDVGVILPRARRLYDWSADVLGLPGVAGLLSGDVPSYAWDPADRHYWTPPPSRPARAARRVVPVRKAAS